jgi:hypothetical protein
MAMSPPRRAKATAWVVAPDSKITMSKHSAMVTTIMQHPTGKPPGYF